MKQKTNHENAPFNFIFESFSSYREFFRICDSRERNPDSSFNNTRASRPDSRWTFAKSYDDAKNKILYGDPTLVPNLKTSLSALQKRAPSRGYVMQESTQGFIPIVPNAMLGLPNSMLDIQLKPKKQKIVSFYLDVGLPCCVSAQTYRDQGIKILNLLLNLEKQGYRVRLSLLDFFCDSKSSNHEAYGFTLPVKNENQPLNLKRVAFPFMDTGFNRLCGFDWYERLPGAKYFSAYGYSLGVRKESLNQEILNTVLPSYGYYLNYKTDLTQIERRIANTDFAKAG